MPENIIDEAVMKEIQQQKALFFGSALAISPAIYLPGGRVITLRNPDKPSSVPRFKLYICRDERLIVIRDDGISATIVGQYVVIAPGIVHIGNCNEIEADQK